ncbi:hypothetical protein PWR63_04460 [Paraburkholderia sp. A2WS-5]
MLKASSYTGQVRHGNAKTLLSGNQSIYIPLDAAHHLFNRGKNPLELIDVHSGAHLGENDIVRSEDTYRRVCRSGIISQANATSHAS